MLYGVEKVTLTQAQASVLLTQGVLEALLYRQTFALFLI